MEKKETNLRSASFTNGLLKSSRVSKSKIRKYAFLCYIKRLIS
jgi:hypothetical protein